MKPESPIAVIIPTYRRTATLRQTLLRIQACDPPPGQILVHIDASDNETSQLLDSEFRDQVHWIQSNTSQGPGGGRNILIQRSRYPFFASFDDDSYPLDPDYFAKACHLLESRPSAAIIANDVQEPGRLRVPAIGKLTQCYCFEGCGHVGRVEAFHHISGYVPLRHAYGMEEADVALQLLDKGWQILQTSQLRIFHDSDLTHHATAILNASQIRNTGLKAYLRYPLTWWPYGLLQIASRILYCVRKRRFNGIMTGVLSIPAACVSYRHHRAVINSSTLRKVRSAAL